VPGEETGRGKERSGECLSNNYTIFFCPVIQPTAERGGGVQERKRKGITDLKPSFLSLRSLPALSAEKVEGRNPKKMTLLSLTALCSLFHRRRQRLPKLGGEKKGKLTQEKRGRGGGEKEGTASGSTNTTPSTVHSLLPLWTATKEKKYMQGRKKKKREKSYTPGRRLTTSLFLTYQFDDFRCGMRRDRRKRKNPQKREEGNEYHSSTFHLFSTYVDATPE